MMLGFKWDQIQCYQLKIYWHIYKWLYVSLMVITRESLTVNRKPGKSNASILLKLSNTKEESKRKTKEKKTTTKKRQKTINKTAISIFLLAIALNENG